MSAGLVLLGVVLVCVAFGSNTTVPNDYSGGGTHNLGLLQQQMMVLHTGLASIVVGAILSLKQQSQSAALTPENEEAATERASKLRTLDRKLLVGMLVLLVGVFALAFLSGN